jgi:hypothetical protein
MTVALGILAGNAQIIAADTQMSTDTEKLGQGKISVRFDAPREGREQGIIVITGAGDAPTLKGFKMTSGISFARSRSSI